MRFADNQTVAIYREDGEPVTYQRLTELEKRFYKRISSHRSLLFVLADNSIESLVAYLSSIKNHIVVAMLSNEIPQIDLFNLIEKYRPEYLWSSADRRVDDYEILWQNKEYKLFRSINRRTWKLSDELALLLPTSGTTGSCKFVRISYRNLAANTRDIVKYLQIRSSHRTITTLPMNYSFGLSIINTYLFAGASIVINNKMVIQPDFWQNMEKFKVTSVSGVPYTYDMIRKVNPFEKYELSYWEVMTQAGGGMQKETWQYFSRIVKNRNMRFYVMYGQTEATARMAYLDPNLFELKQGSIGQAIPHGKLSLHDNNGQKVFMPYTKGEIVYMGENVSLGYANSGEDLKKPDENHGILNTGDIGYFDEDDIFYLLGRKGRYAKIYGLRIDLEYVQKTISEFSEREVYCVSDNKKIYCVYEEELNKGVLHNMIKEIGVLKTDFIWIQTNLDLFRKKNGKICYTTMLKYCEGDINAGNNQGMSGNSG